MIILIIALLGTIGYILYAFHLMDTDYTDLYGYKNLKFKKRIVFKFKWK